MSEWMFRLVEPDPSAARQGDLGDASPTRLVEWAPDGDPFLFQLLGCRLDVVAQEVELVMIRLLGRMDRDLRGRKREDQPAAAGIDGVEAQYRLEERTVGFGIAAVDDYMRARNQRLHPVSLSSALVQVAAKSPEPTRSGDPTAEGRRSGEDDQDAEAEHHAEVELQR